MDNIKIHKGKQDSKIKQLPAPTPTICKHLWVDTKYGEVGCARCGKIVVLRETDYFVPIRG